MTKPDSIPDDQKARRTIARIREGMASGRVPFVPQIIELIRAITLHVDKISVQQLADIMSQDPGVMARVIGIANRLGYNRSGVEITTIHQAISIIGFERIRNLAISVMLMDNAESQLSAEESREVAGISLASGFLTAEMMRMSNAADRETAFVCAALRSYGRLLMTTFLIEEYQQAKVLRARMASDDAYRQVFGLTPLELGRILLESEQLPAIILDTMRQVAPKKTTEDAASPTEELIAVSEYSVRVFELLEEPDLNATQFETRAAQMARELLPDARLSPKQIRDHVRQVDLMCAEVSSSAGGNFEAPLFKRVHALAEDRPLPPPSVLARRIHKIAAQQAAEAATTANSVRALEQAAAELGRLLDRDPDDLPGFFGTLTRLLHGTLRFNESVIFLQNPGLDTYAARFGEGSVFDRLRHLTVINRRQRDIFGLCLNRGENIFLQDPSDPKLRAFIPNWLAGVAQGHRLLLLVFKDTAGCFGLALGILRDQKAFDVLHALHAELANLQSVFQRLGSTVRKPRKWPAPAAGAAPGK